uniref:Uncharacterized protein n=1 Tax=Arundo donax TaxID=35708 RepID=A0A0A9AZF9_ARUDO
MFGFQASVDFQPTKTEEPKPPNSPIRFLTHWPPWPMAHLTHLCLLPYTHDPGPSSAATPTQTSFMPPHSSTS